MEAEWPLPSDSSDDDDKEEEEDEEMAAGAEGAGGESMFRTCRAPSKRCVGGWVICGVNLGPCS